MHVCHIRFTHYVGQGNVALYEYTKALSTLGHTVHVLVVGKECEPTQNVINGVNVHRIFLPSPGCNKVWAPLFFLKACCALNALAKTERIDIAHVYVCPGSFLVPVFGDKNLQYILDVRSGGIRGQIWNLLVKLIIKIESKFFDEITVLDKGVAQNLFGDKKVSIVPLGANFKKFVPANVQSKRENLGIKEHEILFIYVGNLHKERMIEIVISAFKRVHEQYKNTKLLIAGKGKNLGVLKAHARRLGLEKAVIFTGYIDYSVIQNIMNAADIAISYIPITSKYDYQPPLKTVEYMACKIPTIATNTAGNRLFIKDTYNGILVNDSEDAVAGAMKMLIEDKDLQKILKENSRKSVMKYDWHAIVKNNLVPTYENLLGEKE